MTTELFGVTPAAANTASPARRHKMVARGLLVAVMAGGLALGMALPAAASGREPDASSIRESSWS